MKEEEGRNEKAPMTGWMAIYEALKSKFRHEDQMIVVETKDFDPEHPQPGAELVIEVEDGTPELCGRSAVLKGWSAIDEEVRKLVESGNVRDLYIDCK